MRTLVDIPATKVQSLDTIAGRQKVSRAELIRRGVDMVLAAEHAAERADLDAAFGSWKGSGIDGLEFVRKLRAEWDDDAPLADI